MLTLSYLLAFLLPLSSPPPVAVSWVPEHPVQGSMIRIVARPAVDDSVASVRAEFAGEPLHFERDSSTGAFEAYAGVPVDAQLHLLLPLVVEHAGGTVDTVLIRMPILRGRYAMEHLTVAPEFTEKPDSALTARLEREAALIRQAWLETHVTPRLWRDPFERPRDSHITSVYGTGREFNGVVQNRHLGTDFRGAVGDPIRASNDGVVTLIGDFYYSGNMVVIDHGAGIATAYLHMSRVLVLQGDTVTRGQLIGLVGSTGRVTGPHLHWIAKYGQISVNPLSLLALTAEPAGGAPRREDPPATRPVSRVGG